MSARFTVEEREELEKTLERIECEGVGEIPMRMPMLGDPPPVTDEWDSDDFSGGR